jgi:hypothetical protein
MPPEAALEIGLVARCGKSERNTYPTIAYTMASQKS